MIPYGKQDINKEDIDSLVDVLKSDFLTQGPKIPEFEKSVSELSSSSFSIAVTSAHSWITLSMSTLLD